MRSPPTILLWYAALRERLPRGPLLIDLASSYALSIARVGAAAGIVGLLYRRAGPAYVAIFVFARAALSLLNYAYTGFNASVQRALMISEQADPAYVPPFAETTVAGSSTPPTLDYAGAPSGDAVFRGQSDRVILRHANVVVLLITLLAFVAVQLVGTIASGADTWGKDQNESVYGFYTLFGLGLMLRLVGEPAAGVSQARRMLWADNIVQLIGELGWLAAVWIALPDSPGHGLEKLTTVAIASAVTGAGIALGRALVGYTSLIDPASPIKIDNGVAATLFRWAVGLSLGSIADFLYGPSNVLLIRKFLHQTDVADYGPALQIDGALLLTVSAVATVLLPRVVEASQHNDLAHVRRLYVNSSLISLGILVAGAVFIVTLRDVLLRHWLGTVPEATRMILPWVLVHTVIGGTAGVGRAVLLGLGRFRAYTVSALIGGIANVALAVTFVLLGLGLRGIALATIIAVTIRCALWMPWYVLRATGSARALPPSRASD